MKIYDCTDLDRHTGQIQADFTAWTNSLDYLAIDCGEEYEARIANEIMELVLDQKLIDQLREAREAWKAAAERREAAA